MNAFTNSAAFYEVLSDSEARLQREGPLLLELLAQAPGVRVVDLACGTGLHAEYLAGHGAIVTASDLSHEMVAHATQRRRHANLTFVQMDMRAVQGGPWDLALCLGNSLSLLPTHLDVNGVFHAVARVLASKGLFLVQLVNYSSDNMQEPRHRVERRQVLGGEVVATKSLVPHGGRTLLSMAFFHVQDGKVDSLAETAVQLNLDQAALVDAVAATGLHLVAAYGGYDKRPYQPQTSADLVCVFRKA
jgi:trans-aconitate methyltransferase